MPAAASNSCPKAFVPLLGSPSERDHNLMHR